MKVLREDLPKLKSTPFILAYPTLGKSIASIMSHGACLDFDFGVYRKHVYHCDNNKTPLLDKIVESCARAIVALRVTPSVKCVLSNEPRLAKFVKPSMVLLPSYGFEDLVSRLNKRGTPPSDELLKIFRRDFDADFANWKVGDVSRVDNVSSFLEDELGINFKFSSDYAIRVQIKEE